PAHCRHDQEQRDRPYHQYGRREAQRHSGFAFDPYLGPGPEGHFLHHHRGRARGLCRPAPSGRSGNLFGPIAAWRTAGMSGKVPITLRGAELLRAELHRLKTVDRPNIVAAIAEARSHGDISENAEYDSAKERQGFIEGRIQEIEGKLGNAQIIDPASLDADGRVVFGATVELEDQDNSNVVT